MRFKEYLIQETVFDVKPKDRMAAKKPSTFAAPLVNRIVKKVKAEAKGQKTVERLEGIANAFEAAGESGDLGAADISAEVREMIVKRLKTRERIMSSKKTSETAERTFRASFFNAIAQGISLAASNLSRAEQDRKKKEEEQAKAERTEQRKADTAANQSLQRRGRRQRRAGRA
jgi:hypothetical protein